MQCDTSNFSFFIIKITSWLGVPLRGIRHCLSAGSIEKKSRKLCDTNWSPPVHVAAHQKRPLTKPQVFKYHMCLYAYIPYVDLYACRGGAHEDIHLNAFRWMNTCACIRCVPSLKWVDLKFCARFVFKLFKLIRRARRAPKCHKNKYFGELNSM